MIVVILAFVCSTLIAMICVPLLARIARYVGLVDHPDDQRKLHTDSIPMVGGVAVFLTVVLVVPAAVYIGIEYQPFFVSLGQDLLGWLPINFERRTIQIVPLVDYHELLGLLIGSAVLVVVGILDDRFGIAGRKKLFGQLVATTVLILFGYHFDKLFGIDVNSTVISVLFVYAWVIAAINSVNLLDGADGIASTIGIVMSLALSIMAVYQGQMVTAIIAVAMAGALTGFLRFNFPPAKVYLGDTGSMLIGFVLSALAIRCTLKQNTAFAFFAPIALLAIPFLDTGAAIVRRRLTGRSIFAVDRGHLHHALMKRGYSAKVSLLWVALLCTTTAAGGVMSLLTQHYEYALVSIAIVILVMISFKLFGVAECQLISRKATSLASSVFRITSSDNPLVRQSSVHVQGSRNWHGAWDQLCEFAEGHGLIQMTLDLNAPWIHESFHATWRRADAPRGDNHQWYSQIPLIAGGRLFGRIEMIGSGQNGPEHRDVIKDLLLITADVEYLLTESSLDSIDTELDQSEEDEAIADIGQPTSLSNGTHMESQELHPLDADSDATGSTASTS